MTAEGDERVHYAGGGAGAKFRKRPFRPEINEEPQNVSQEAGQSDSSGVSQLSTHEVGNYAAIGISELEQILKQKTFTRSEIQHLIALLHSRITEESLSDTVDVERDGVKHHPPSVLRLEASTSGSLKKHKLGDDSDNFHAAVFSSRAVEQQIAEISNAYKGSTIGTGQASTQDPKLIDNNATGFPKTSVASPQHPTTLENLPHELLSNIFICANEICLQVLEFPFISILFHKIPPQPFHP